MEPGVVALVVITFLAAVAHGALGYGFKLAQGARACSVRLAAVLIDAILLYAFFSRNVSLRRNRPAAG